MTRIDTTIARGLKLLQIESLAYPNPDEPDVAVEARRVAGTLVPRTCPSG